MDLESTPQTETLAIPPPSPAVEAVRHGTRSALHAPDTAVAPTMRIEVGRDVNNAPDIVNLSARSPRDDFRMPLQFDAHWYADGDNPITDDAPIPWLE